MKQSRLASCSSAGEPRSKSHAAHYSAARREILEEDVKHHIRDWPSEILHGAVQRASLPGPRAVHY